MQRDLVSVIVPVYNAKDYLDKCVESISNQTYDNLEIILVNDGSTDNSGKMCDLWAKRDSRIRVIHKKNGGASSARNNALDIITGSYVIFVDSDDYISNHMIETLYSNIKNENADISMCSSFDVYEKKIKHNKIKNKYLVMDKISTYKYMLKPKYFGIGNTCKLFKKIVLENVRFDEKRGNGEDAKFMYQVLLNTTKNIYDSKPLYYYYHHSNSLTTSRRLDTGLSDSFCELLLFTKKNIPELYIDTLTQYVLSCFQTYNKGIIINSNYYEIKEYEKVIKDNYHKINHTYLTFYKKTQLFIFYYFTPIYNYILKIIKK